jgi:integrase
MSSEYQVKLFKPGKAHKSYRLYKLWAATRKMERIESPELDRLNQELAAKRLSPREVERLAEEVRNGHRRARDAQKGIAVPFFNNDNLALLVPYLEAYQKRRKTAPESKHRRTVELKRAIGMLAQVSLRVATEDELTDQLFKACPDPGVYNAMAGCLNSVLKHAGRDVRIQTLATDFHSIKYINETDLKIVISTLPDHFKLQCKVAFATGCRWGECLALESNRIKIRPDSNRAFIHVHQAWHRTRKALCPPKRGKRRDALILSGYLKDVQEWVAIPQKDRLEMVSPSAALLKACAKLWPNDPVKHCTVHSLRHSYATHLLQKGVSLSLVARFLGNHLKVTEAYYTAFTFGDDDLHLPSGL